MQLCAPYLYKGNLVPLNFGMVKTVVMSVGGSLINPGKIDVAFLQKLKTFIEQSPHCFVIICGGGAPARAYTKAAAKLGLDHEHQDWVGISATLLNAELVRHFLGAPPVQQTPKKIDFEKVLVTGGWKPGWSTDFCAVKWGEKLGIKNIVNLSNTDYVYSDDPKKNPKAKPLKQMLWADYRPLIAEEWTPGLSTPFDPVASKTAQRLNMTVAIINGSRLKEVQRFLDGDQFVGTVIE